MIFKKVLFLYISFPQDFVIKMFINTPLKRVRARDINEAQRRYSAKAPPLGSAA